MCLCSSLTAKEIRRWKDVTLMYWGAKALAPVAKGDFLPAVLYLKRHSPTIASASPTPSSSSAAEPQPACLEEASPASPSTPFASLWSVRCSSPNSRRFWLRACWAPHALALSFPPKSHLTYMQGICSTKRITQAKSTSVPV